MAATQVDIVIIGGGISGLSAGLAIADANAAAKAEDPQAPQVSYVVLEATARFGGRTLTGDDVALDFGGGYIGATQNYLQWLIHRFQLPTIAEFLPNDEKFKWLYEDGQGNITRFPGNDPFAFPGGNNALALLLQLDGMALEVRNHLRDPGSSIQANLDKISAQDFITRQRAAWDAVHPAGAPIPNPDPNFDIGMSPQTAEVFTVSVRSAFSVEPKELSFFFLLYYAATAGGYSALVDVSGGAGAAEGTRFALGTQSLVSALTDQNYPNVRPNSLVRNIDYRGQGVTVRLDDATTFNAKQVVVAMSPPASAKLNYVPALNTTEDGQKRASLCADMQSCLGRTIKGFVRFKTAFWRDRSLMGFLLSSTPDFKRYPLNWTLDNVWAAPDDVPYSGSGDRYSIMTFIVGAAADYWSAIPAATRAAAVIAHLKHIFGFTDEDLLDSANPAGNYVEQNWPQQTGAGVGSPNANMPNGTLTKYGSALFTPIGPIHWAGSESATEWCGYMNGAVQAGFRAATEALAELAAAAAGAAAPKAPGGGGSGSGASGGSGFPGGSTLAGGDEAA